MLDAIDKVIRLEEVKKSKESNYKKQRTKRSSMKSTTVRSSMASGYDSEGDTINDSRYRQTIPSQMNDSDSLFGVS